MKNNILLLALLALFTACNDFLDQSPDSDLDVAIDTEDKIAELLTGAYPQASTSRFSNHVPTTLRNDPTACIRD